MLEGLHAGFEFVWAPFCTLQRADERGHEGLNIKKFKAAFSRILEWKNEHQLVSMFKKIDTKSAGTIDWVWSWLKYCPACQHMIWVKISSRMTAHIYRKCECFLNQHEQSLLIFESTPDHPLLERWPDMLAQH